MIGGMVLDALDFAASAMVKEEDIHPRGVLWRGLPGGKGDLSSDQLRALQEAGVEEIIVNVNGVKTRRHWKWEGGRRRICHQIETYRRHGFTVAVMPWVWADLDFMKRCALELTNLSSDMGEGAIRMIQLDWEGSAESSAKSGARRAGVSIPAFVDQALTALAQDIPPSIALGITTLYFRRKAGDAAIMWERTINGYHRSLAEWIGQYYSPWLSSPPHSKTKAKATHAANFQPPILQRRGREFYLPLYGHMSDQGVGINAWALKRPAMTAAQAMDLAVEEVRGQEPDTFALWAGHLIKGNAARFDLALKAYRRICKGCERRVDPGQDLEHGSSPSPAPSSHSPLLPSPPHCSIDWDGRWHDERVASGGRPSGFVSIRRKGMSARSVGPLARAIRSHAIRQGWPRGTCVPCSYKTRSLVGVLQKHTATYKGGRLVTGLDLDGLTIFAQR